MITLESIKRKIHAAFELSANYASVSSLSKPMQACYARMVKHYGSHCKVEVNTSARCLECKFVKQDPMAHTASPMGSCKVSCTRSGNYRVSCKVGNRKERTKTCKHERDVTHFIDSCFDM